MSNPDERWIDGYGPGAQMMDGVRLTTRSRRVDIGHMVRIVAAIGEAFQESASKTVASIYEDDEREGTAFYEVRLADDLSNGWDETFAQEVRVMFRECGGYNGLVIRNGRRENMVDDKPWWLPDAETMLRLTCDQCGAVAEGALPEETTGAGRELINYILALPEADIEKYQYRCQECASKPSPSVSISDCPECGGSMEALQPECHDASLLWHCISPRCGRVIRAAINPATTMRNGRRT
jgi:hypothetical protein